MNRSTDRRVWGILTLPCLLLLPRLAAAVAIETVLVGNPGNAADPATGYGAVDDLYRIGKYEVTNAQYTEFLNAVDPGGTSTHLYTTGMANDANGGILKIAGNPTGSKYEVKSGRANNPVILVSAYDAMRFANWLHNGQGSGSTETGAYTLGPLGLDGIPLNPANITRSTDARWFLPTRDQWYKAAYHQPAAEGGDADGYWAYPTGTNDTPYSDQPPGSGAPTPANTANFFRNDGLANGYNDGYAVTGLTIRSNTINYLTDVGAYTSSSGHYGTFDQAGNVMEWNGDVMTVGGQSFLFVMGGSWFNDAVNIAASHELGLGLYGEFINVGFRVATIPEPGTIWLAALAGGGLLLAAANSPRCAPGGKSLPRRAPGRGL